MIIRNGQVALPTGALTAVDIRVHKRRIAGIGARLPDDGGVLDAEGLFVLPGGIDPHVLCWPEMFIRPRSLCNHVVLYYNPGLPAVTGKAGYELILSR